MQRTRLIGLLTALGFLLPVAVQAQEPGPAAQGAVSAVQARRGEATFKQTCAACHATSQFTAAQYIRAWSDRPVIELFEQLRSSMPQDNPGGLTRQQYLDVVLYLYRLNGATEGEQELPPDDEAMKNARIRLKPAGALEAGTGR